MDAADFKQGMRHLAAAVNIITTEYQAVPMGMTATAMCSLTAEPPSLLICVNKTATSHEMIRRSGRFAVNVLSTDDVAVANRFAGGSPEGRFETGVWARLDSGVWALETALVTFDCSLAGDIPYGTHSILLGRVEGVTVRQGRDPLLYAEGKYAQVNLSL